jgi:hypothetical protein
MRNRVSEIGLAVLAIVAAFAGEWLIASLFLLGAVALYEYHARDLTKAAKTHHEYHFTEWTGAAETPLICSLGNHAIGNEPYSFFSDSVDVVKEEYAAKPYCLKCKAFRDSEVARVIAESDAFIKELKEKMEARRREWDAIPIDVKRSALEANLSKWATKGNDGIWRRNDSGEVVELNAEETHVK